MCSRVVIGILRRVASRAEGMEVLLDSPERPHRFSTNDSTRV